MTDDAVKNLALSAIDAAARVDELTKPSLVERLRSTCDPGCKCTKREAADRIEALERENGNLRRAKELFSECAAQVSSEADLLARALIAAAKALRAFAPGVATDSLQHALTIAERRVKGE